MMTTRKEFIASLCAAALAPRRLFAAGKADFDDSLAVLLSDVHVNGNDENNGKKCSATMRYWLRENVAEILRMDPLPRNVVIFGDLAYLHGRLVDYQRSYPDLKLLVDAGVKVTIGMGNHDHRKAFLEVWPEYEKRTLVPGFIVSMASLADFDIVMLDSLNEKDEPDSWNPVGGALGAAEQEWMLAELPKWPRPFMLGAHHAAWELRFGNGKKSLEQMIDSFPNCRGFIHGHDHIWKTGIVNWRNPATVPFMTLPSNGFWGDIGYAALRGTNTAQGRKAAVAKLVLKDFWLGGGAKKPARDARPPMWDARVADAAGARCTFPL